MIKSRCLGYLALVMVLAVSACTLPSADLHEPAALATVQSVSEETERDGESSGEQSGLLAKLKSRGAAPELLNQVWLNSEPLKLADLRGKVVMVEFWTFG